MKEKDVAREKGFEQSELTKARIKVANLRATYEVNRLKLEDAQRHLAELLDEQTRESVEKTRESMRNGPAFEPQEPSVVDVEDFRRREGFTAHENGVGK